MKTHPILGASMLDRVPYLKRAASIVEAHHERWDGQGYPHGLRGQEIPFGARIFAVVDTFDAMTSDRPYRRALSVEQAVEAILAAAGSQLDPQLAKEFAELCRERMGTWPLEHPEPGDVR